MATPKGEVKQLKDKLSPEPPMIKLLYLALQNIEKKWTMPIRN